MSFLREHLSYDAAKIILEDNGTGGKELYMKGICIQGDQLNANQRIYPTREIATAVNTLNEQIKAGYSVLGEIDHPDDLKINLDRVSHMITEMWMEGTNGHGTLKILPTPMGAVIKSMLENEVKLGVSSRGSGNVDDGSGHVSEFEIITIDIVAQPSAQNAFPQAVYESIMNVNGGLKLLGIAEDACDNKRIQKHLRKEMINIINRLKW